MKTLMLLLILALGGKYHSGDRVVVKMHHGFKTVVEARLLTTDGYTVGKRKIIYYDSTDEYGQDARTMMPETDITQKLDSIPKH